MGKLFTLLLVGAGAVYMWRRSRLQLCPGCRREVRVEAPSCRFCGERLGEAPVIDVEATEPRA